MKHIKRKSDLSNSLPIPVIDEKSLDAVISGAGNSNSAANHKVTIGAVQLNSGATWGKEAK